MEPVHRPFIPKSPKVCFFPGSPVVIRKLLAANKPVCKPLLLVQFNVGEISMATDVHAREQRLRKQAELQSLYLNLSNLRKQEASYIEVSAAMPDLLVHQINELRQEINGVENELLGLNDESIQVPARQFYREAVEAELAGDTEKAIKLYKNAAHYNHPDAGAAIRSVRYGRKMVKNRAAGGGKTWTPADSAKQTRNRALIGLAGLLILVLVVVIWASGRFFSSPPEAVSAEPSATLTPPAVILIVPATATPFPSPLPPTATSTPIPTDTPTPADTPTSEALPTDTPTPAPTLRPAPRIIGPTNNLVWLDGAVVFEFEELDLAFDELYCVNTLRGFDKTNTENWSFPATGNKKPAVPIEANVMRVAKAQDMRCIVWSGSIGKGSCDNIISYTTEERVIGLPQPCNFK